MMAVDNKGPLSCIQAGKIVYDAGAVERWDVRRQESRQRGELV